MQTHDSAAWPSGSADPAPAWRVLDALLYSVSHDLRSPLLTMTLSADLVQEGLSPASGGEQASETVSIALDAFRRGAADLERMLEALTRLSRARRQEITPAKSSLRLILGGYTVTGGASPDTTVTVDAIEVREFIDGLAGDGDAAVEVARDGGLVTICVASVHESVGEVTPLDALAGSLHLFAGTPVEALAVRQILLERRDCEVSVVGGRVRVALPVAVAE